MLLTISTTHSPATDLGYLLAKHPARCQTFRLSHGRAHVFYPEASAERCTAALLLDVDPIGLVRGRSRGDHGDGALAQYVNDRPYVASSFLSVAIAQVFGSALRGACKERPELARTPIPLTAALSVVPCAEGESFLRRLFEPLGYAVTAERVPLDETFPEWGAGPYHRVTLRGATTLARLLAHLYVLVPVLDDQKHYWVGRDEVEKLLAHGEGWLSDHPARQEIAERYLKHHRGLAHEAIRRLLADDQVDPDATDEREEREEAALERPLSLLEQRVRAVAAVLEEAGARRVIDLGCGEGRLMEHLLRDRRFTQVTGVDVSHRALAIAARRLALDRMPEAQRRRVDLIQGSLTYRDARFAGHDAACLIEVIEHVDPARLGALERVVFEHARPPLVVVTTPNAEYNALFASLAAGRFRHRDHRFEWTRSELEAWASRVAGAHGYAVRLEPIGPVDERLGAPTQMGVFTR